MQPDPTTTAAPLSGRRLIAIEAELDWYFGEAVTFFERSTFGPQLEMAELYGTSTRPCFRCGGVPASKYGGEVQGSGFSSTGTECRSCRGSGMVADGAHAEVGELTARPRTTAAVSCHSYDMARATERQLMRFAIASRAVKAVARRRAILAAVLRAYYGDTGARWGRTEHGRILAVYPLTPEGAKLVEASRRRSSAFLPEDETLGVELVLQRQQPQDIRKHLINRADLGARRLHLEALAVTGEVWDG
ncbi:MAG: hypothetical protein AMXMBFR56_66120 [Polyangiaceae bacterium]